MVNDRKEIAIPMYVIKKDGTHEEFNVQKIIIAVNKLVMGFIDNGSLAGILATPNSRGKIIVTQLLSLYIWLIILMVCVTAVGLVSANAMFPDELNVEKYLYLNAGTLMLWFAVAGITFLAACISVAWVLFGDEYWKKLKENL